MCKFCTTEDITAAAILKDGKNEYRGEMCQIHYFGKDGGIVHEGDEAIPYLCFFSRAFGDKAALVKINNCPWCGRKLGQ